MELVELLALGLGDAVLVEFGYFGMESIRGQLIAGLALVVACVLCEHLSRNKLLNGLFTQLMLNKDF